MGLLFYRQANPVQEPVQIVITPSTATITTNSSQFFSVQALNVPEGEGFTAVASIDHIDFSIENPNLIFFGDPLTAGFNVSYNGFISQGATLVVSGSDVQAEIEIQGEPDSISA